MFNQPAPRPHASGFANDSFPFSHQPWGRFDLYQTPAEAGHGAPAPSYAPSAMEWTPTSSEHPPDYDQQHQHQHQHHHHHNHHHHHHHQGSHGSDDVELEPLSPVQAEGGGAGGVGRLVAHFENKGFAPLDNKPYAPPPLHPPPPPLRAGHGLQTQQSMAKPPPHFDQLAYLGSGSGLAGSPFSGPNRAATPVGGLAESQWPSYGLQSRVASPIAAGNPAFGGFHDTPRAAAGPLSAQFGGLDDFVSGGRVHSPPGPSLPPSHMAPSPLASPTQPSPPAAGTPGFEIWRPPGSVGVKSEAVPSAARAAAAAAAAAAGFAKPPVPSTPKPSIGGTGNQFILEFNPCSVKAKGKAPAKPARLRAQPPPVPPPFSSEIKQEAASEVPPLSTAALPVPAATLRASLPGPSHAPQRQAPASLRAHAGPRPSREQVPAEAWEQFKGTIRSLYLDERRPLKEVMAIMAEKYNFQATPKMYKTRFSQWGFVKNNTEDEVKRLLSMKFQRDAEGKVSEFVRNGRVVNLGTYLKRKGVTEYDLIDFELPADLPAHVKCRTPTPPPAPDYLRSPDLLRAQELVVGNMRKAFLHCRQLEVEAEAHIGWPVTMVWGANSSDLLMEANFYFEARDADQGGRCLMRAFKQLESDLKKMSPLAIKELLLGMVQRDPGMMTALCKYLAAYSTTNLERSHPLRQIFTCLYEVQQKHGPGTLSDLLWGSTPTIAEELEAIYSRRHPYVARAWLDLALFYNHADSDRLEKLVAELRAQERQVEQRHGARSPDMMALRYTIVQLLYAAGPQSKATKHAAAELWGHMRDLGIVFPVRDAKPNVFCYHSPVKVDPRTKRCRRRYDSGSAILEEHVGVKVLPYFEEDFHTTPHAQDAQEAWSAALNHAQSSKFAFI